MNSDDLFMYLNGEDTVDSIRAKINPLLKKWSMEKGSSRPIQIQKLEKEIFLTKRHILRAANDFLAESLSEAEMDYLMCCIELCEDFVCEDESVREAVFELSAPEVNGPLTLGRAKKVIASFLS
jgi:hypothetical protein